MDTREQFIAEIRAFMAATGASAGAVGNLVGRNYYLVTRLEDGRGCSLDTMVKARAIMAKLLAEGWKAPKQGRPRIHPIKPQPRSEECLAVSPKPENETRSAAPPRRNPARTQPPP